MSIIPFVVEAYLYSLRRKKKGVMDEIKVCGNCSNVEPELKKCNYS